MYTALLQLLNQIVSLDEEEELLIKESFHPYTLSKGDFSFNPVQSISKSGSSKEDWFGTLYIKQIKKPLLSFQKKMNL